jgi:hypothetical protein
MIKLDVTSLDIECHADGSAKVSAWVKCWTTDDIDDVIAWLELAKTMMQKWEAIRKGEPNENTEGR